ncbi:uncharacterized protein LOC117786314 [Drosophila innubila]|uniref:uncharacterized protein LOC117786314 n=1 Tax=Drosophila innubila TaxID=198719 RepID=UPI00148D96BA|nr:uncharacterized protein LOC117786314 [Drosophila innubila]
MDLNSIENRLMILECLKENAHNMLVEQVNLRDRISMVLGRARNTLASIRVLNSQVREMKVTVENALAANMELSNNENMWGMIEGDSVEEPLEAIEEAEILEEENSGTLIERYSINESTQTIEDVESLTEENPENLCDMIEANSVEISLDDWKDEEMLDED